MNILENTINITLEIINRHKIFFDTRLIEIENVKNMAIENGKKIHDIESKEKELELLLFNKQNFIKERERISSIIPLVNIIKKPDVRFLFIYFS